MTVVTFYTVANQKNTKLVLSYSTVIEMADTGELIGQIQHLLYQAKGNGGGFVLHCFKFGYLKSQCTEKFRSCVSFSQSLHS